MKIHLTPEGPKACTVDPSNPKSRGCKYGEHYDDWGSAQEAFEEVLKKENTVSATVEASDEVRYSFVEGWEKIREKFEVDFEGFPTRFFTTDLYNSKVEWALSRLERGYQYPGDVLSRLALISSSPSDFAITSEELVSQAEYLGLENIEEIEDVRIKAPLKTDRLWRATFNGKTVFITGSAQGSRSMRSGYKFRRQLASLGEFAIIDSRGIAGSARLKRKTGVNPVELVHSPKPSPRMVKMSGKWVKRDDDEYWADTKRFEEENVERSERIRELVALTEAARQEGANFRAQAAYIKEHTGRKIASAWQDKLYPSKTHQKLAVENTLLRDFAKIEVDNDVNEAEFRDFEKSWEAAREKLPVIPNGIKPTLRIRKLGKHRADGLYAPLANTVCIDVRTSAATVHELGHYYDFAVKQSASLNKDFSSVVRDYSRSLKVPEGGGKAAAYYETPTEVFARAFELYAVERLGVSGRVVKPSSEYSERFDYKPFSDSPGLKERVFKIFDELF